MATGAAFYDIIAKRRIGRVYDSRYGRDCIDEVKFPLGVWHQAQSRLFDVPCNDGATRRQIRVTIQEIDFVYQAWRIHCGFTGRS